MTAYESVLILFHFLDSRVIPENIFLGNWLNTDSYELNNNINKNQLTALPTNNCRLLDTVKKIHSINLLKYFIWIWE